jgi:hypothetical protein
LKAKSPQKNVKTFVEKTPLAWLTIRARRATRQGKKSKIPCGKTEWGLVIEM